MAALANRQHGVVSRRQLRELGFGEGAIKSRLASGRLQLLHRSVYAVGHRTLRAQGAWMAAVLASGPGAVLSHRDAGAVWDLVPAHAGTIDVTTTRNRHGTSSIRVHRVRRLHPEDWTTRERIPVTSVPRTFLDLAEVLPPQPFERAFEQGERLQLIDLWAIERLCARSPGRRGVRPLTALLADGHAEATHDTRSELERRFLDLCRSAGLPSPATNASVAGFEVDAYWPQARLVVELDGYAYHRTRGAFERDRERDAVLQVAGCRTLRVTDRRINREPRRLVAQLRSLLGGD